jgi:hypothetical protein
MSRPKPVLAIGPDQAPRLFPSISDAGRDGFDRRHIWHVLTLQREHHRGLWWAYARTRDAAFLWRRRPAPQLELPLEGYTQVPASSTSQEIHP